MKRKSKGQIAREQKKEKMLQSSLFSDPLFLALPLRLQVQLTKLIDDKVEEKTEIHETIGYQKGMLDCMTCVIQVLAEDYWKKAPIRKWNKFAWDVSDLMNSHLRGVVTWDEMIEYIKEKTNLTIETKWLGMDKRPTPRDMFGGHYEKTTNTACTTNAAAN